MCSFCAAIGVEDSEKIGGQLQDYFIRLLREVEMEDADRTDGNANEQQNIEFEKGNKFLIISLRRGFDFDRFQCYD